jgi:hypothetical protein
MSQGRRGKESERPTSRPQDFNKLAAILALIFSPGQVITGVPAHLREVRGGREGLITHSASQVVVCPL